MTATLWTLAAALGIGKRPELIAIVGGGGKSSLMFALAAELPGRVVMTTTTRIFAAQMNHAPTVIYENDLASLGDALDAHGRCLVVGHVEGDKAVGVDPELPARLLARTDVDYVLVEADGSRMRPVKAPAEHEPVIPPGTTLLVPVAGIDALEDIIEDVAHRPENVRRIANEDRPEAVSDQRLIVDDRLTSAGLARLLAHPSGGLKDAPDTARIVPLLNKVETAERLAAAREVAGRLLREPRVARVILGALRKDAPAREVWRRVTAVVMAAGTSSRMGHNKLLLPWGDSAVLERTLGNVVLSCVTGMITVVGHEREATEPIAVRYGPTTINQDYANGMLSSVQAAVRALPSEVEAALVVLGDQPLVGPDILDKVLTAYAENPHGLVAPTFQGRRGNPVIIDRRYFAELLALPASAAPRFLLQKYPDDLLLVDVKSDVILHDLDRPEDYERLRPKTGEIGLTA